MRTFGRYLGRGLLLLVLAAAVVALWQRETLNRLWTVNTLFDETTIVDNFSNMNAAFLSVSLPKGDGPASDLPQGTAITLPDGAADWIAERDMTSMLVLHKGQIVYEDYFLGTSPDDRRVSWSIAKSYLSALIGILVDEGLIASLDDPVTKYAPTLIGGAYETASIRNVLHMASGVVFDEDYFDQSSDINRMGRVVALGGTLDNFTASFTETFAPPGETWQYVSIDTHVIGMVARGATGRSVSDLLTEKIIAPLGLEQDGYYLTDGAGVAFVLGGLNFTTRDFARFGQMILQDGAYGGQQIVPADWIAASTTPSAPTAPGDIRYGYQWWIQNDAPAGEFLGRGVYGQYLFIDSARDMVIVTTGADRRFRDAGVHSGNVALFRAIAASLEGSS